MGLGLSGLRLGLGQQLWGTVWSPAKLFPTGTEEGLFLDLSDISTLYTDQTFATNISAIGDPVGGVIDKSQGGVLGAEKVPDPSFDTPGAWSAPANWSISGGVATSDGSQSTSVNLEPSPSVSVTIGKTYTVSFEVASVSAGLIRAQGGGIPIVNRTTPGVYTITFTATATANVVLLCDSIFVGVVDNFSIKPLPGNHLIQATSAARPIWTRHPKSGVRNLLDRSEDYSNAVWVSKVGLVSGRDDPAGGTSAYSVENTAGSSQIVLRHSCAATILNEGTLTAATSIWIRRRVGTGTVTFSRPDNSTLDVTASVTSAWTRIETTAAYNSAFAGYFILRLSVLGDIVDVWHPQFELGASATAYQTRVSKYNVTEAGVDDCYGLTFDGVDDYMVTAANLDLSGTDAISNCLGAVTTSASTRSVLLNTGAATPVYYEVRWPSGANTTLGSYYISGVTNQIAEKAGVAFGTPKVVSATNDTTGASAILRIDGAQEGSSVLDPGVYVFPDAVASIGANSAGTYPTAGTIYGVTLTDYTLDAAQLAALETWTAARTPEVTLA